MQLAWRELTSEDAVESFKTTWHRGSITTSAKAHPENVPRALSPSERLRCRVMINLASGLSGFQ